MRSNCVNELDSLDNKNIAPALKENLIKPLKALTKLRSHRWEIHILDHKNSGDGPSSFKSKTTKLKTARDSIEVLFSFLKLFFN